jgi:integration host factor subunit beta
MNKLDLVEALREKEGITKNEAATIVDLVFDEMSNAMANGDRVEIRGLCSFYVKQYKPYIGRNPKTGEKVKINPKNLPFFKCGKELKDRVDK